MCIRDRYVTMYSDGDGYLNGIGFLVHKKLKPLVLNFSPINNRMCSLRIKDKFLNVISFCVYVRKEEAGEDVKEAFYRKLEE